MGINLIIAEKPSVAQKLAYALSRLPQRRMYRRVSYYEFTRGADKIIIASAVGHLFTLKQKSQSTPAFDIEWAPTHSVDKAAWYQRDYLNAIADLAKNADTVINATDYDIEGSLIGYNIIRFVSDLSKAKRMRFSTLTAPELESAYENLEPLDTNNALAGEARHMVDWFYGINLSRAVMNAIRKAGRYKTLSIGRVQGPMLRFLSLREKEVKEFKPTQYWELLAYSKGHKFIHEKERFKAQEEAEEAKRKTSSEGTIHIDSKTKTLYPLPPFDFTTLQAEAYRLFGFIPVKTQQLAQTLYENAYISYPRTSSQKLPHQLNLPSIIRKIATIDRFSSLANQLINGNRFRPREGQKEDVHPAIFPTGNLGKLEPDVQKLYDLIVHRFLGCFAESAEVEDRKIILSAGEKYKASAIHILKSGWFQFYPYAAAKETAIPPFSNDEKVAIEKFEVTSKMTSPPNRFSPASILQLMEKENIGTKTTRAIVLDTLYKRGYVSGRQLTVTPLGMAVYETFQQYSPKIVDPSLTKQLEDEMEMVQNGKMSKQKVIGNAKVMLEGILSDFAKNEQQIGSNLLNKLEESERFASCKCGKGFQKIIEYQGRKFLGCTNYPTCKITYSLPSSGLFSFAELCSFCGSPKVWFIKGKSRYKYCLNRDCPEKLAKLAKKEEKEAEKAAKVRSAKAGKSPKPPKAEKPPKPPKEKKPKVAKPKSAKKPSSRKPRIPTASEPAAADAE
ncbi:Reverse gyrase [uncultured archaeon]|nr:Reverse gyrase [uncultured archaeon]